MQRNSKVILAHLIHTSVLLYSTVMALVFYPCFGLDGSEDYSILFSSGEHTLIFQFYYWSIVIFIVFVFFFPYLNALPYGILFWSIRHRNREPISTKNGVCLTVATLLLIELYHSEAFGLLRFNVSDCIDGGIIMIACVYILPFFFIWSSCQRLQQNNYFRLYIILLLIQFGIYCLLVAYGMTSLPEVLKAFIDNRYRYWQHL